MTDSSRRPPTIAVLAGAASGGLMLLGATRPWATAEVSTPDVPTEVVTVSGSQAVPATAALALVVLAGAVAIVPTGGRLRRAVGGVVTAAGVTAALLAGLAGNAVRSAVAEAVAASPASLGGDPAIGDPALSWWRWLTLIAAVAAAGVGVWTARSGSTWAVMGNRYEVPASSSRVASERDPWRAMDAGEDPTA